MMSSTTKDKVMPSSNRRAVAENRHLSNDMISITEIWDMQTD